MSRKLNHWTSQQIVDMGKGRCKLVPYAQDVAIDRGHIVCEAMMHMAAIRSLRSGGAERNAQVKCIKAHSQTSSATQSQQAAHLARVDPTSPLVLDRAVVYAALERWFSTISRIYHVAGRRKAERGRAEEASVLETYGESFRVANVGRFLQARTPQLYGRYEWLL